MAEKYYAVHESIFFLVMNPGLCDSKQASTNPAILQLSCSASLNSFKKLFSCGDVTDGNSLPVLLQCASASSKFFFSWTNSYSKPKYIAAGSIAAVVKTMIMGLFVNSKQTEHCSEIRSKKQYIKQMSSCSSVLSTRNACI